METIRGCWCSYYGQRIPICTQSNTHTKSHANLRIHFKRSIKPATLCITMLHSRQLGEVNDAKLRKCFLAFLTTWRYLLGDHPCYAKHQNEAYDVCMSSANCTVRVFRYHVHTLDMFRNDINSWYIHGIVRVIETRIFFVWTWVKHSKALWIWAVKNFMDNMLQASGLWSIAAALPNHLVAWGSAKGGRIEARVTCGFVTWRFLGYAKMGKLFRLFAWNGWLSVMTSLGYFGMKDFGFWG